MTIPSFLLAKLYVKGTLKNTDLGFEFNLRNVIDSTSLSGIGPFTLGAETIPAERIALTVHERTWRGSELSGANTAGIPVGVPITVRVDGGRLPAGPARLNVVVTSSDVGALKFDIADTVA